MATTVDYKHADPEVGVYGAYNPFAVIIENLEDPLYNLTFRVKVTPMNDATKVVEKIVNPMGSTGRVIVEPLKLMQDSFFKSVFGDFNTLQTESFSIIKIEVGASYSTVEANAPAFEGYLLSDEFYVYNGYELQPLVMNYRDFYWYSFAPIKLPKIKKEVSLLTNDTELLSFLSKFRAYYSTTDSILTATNYLVDFYRVNDTLIAGRSTDTAIPTPSGVGYLTQTINLLDPSIPATAAYWKVRIRYTSAEEATFDSEEVKVSRDVCNPKQDNYRLYWANRYGGAEYQNFTLAANTTYQVQKGKKIQSDGIDYKAVDFAGIQNINNPNLQEFGNRTTKEITIRSDYFKTQEQVDALAELFKSPVVLMFASNGTHPMIVKTTNFDQELLTQGLYKVDITLQYANNEIQQIQ